ncbi:malonate--CoA ligase ACSF3, mitochondrial [Bactrocera neohumeralis]|uniref:malonate--CoA ligase ACSF3, mitochondrial n=1 Tax=Bactrocera neohumeralis TaxID=98809 RepID=UPI002166A0CE|nr:malonate--CoA ligase ACSF3, mitochondrial [Bactrocera neohumeralis]
MLANKSSIAFKYIYSRIIVTKKISTNIKIFEHLTHLREYFRKEEENGGVVPIFKKVLLHADHIAIKSNATEYSYQQLYLGSKKLSIQISNICGSGASCNVAVFCENNALLPLTQWGCWMSGQVFMPLLHKFPFETLSFIIGDSKSKIIISGQLYEKIAKKLATMFDIPLIIIDHHFIPEHSINHHFLEKTLLTVGSNVFIEGTLNNDFYSCSVAMLVYNNSTAKKPKGCRITHKNLLSRIKGTSQVWDYKSSDVLLNLLPVEFNNYSVHSMMCLLSVGGKIDLCYNINYDKIWNKILGINMLIKDKPNMLTALPSTYTKILKIYAKAFSNNPSMVEYIKTYCQLNIRLMISGSTPLPMNIFYYWYKLTGHKLLRYYETPETGAILGNPYIEDIRRKRKQNSFNVPFPQTIIRIVNSKDKTILAAAIGNTENGGVVNAAQIVSFNTRSDNFLGELHVSGQTIFKGYLHQDDTKICFENNFYKTGIIVEFENNTLRLLGRVDSIVFKRAGRSISSDEIETLLKTHYKIKDVAVVAVRHTHWNMSICAVCVIKAESTQDLANIKLFCSKWLPPHMCPDIFKIVPYIHRNSEGKIEKNHLTKLYYF